MLLDSGIRGGADAFKAIALGARAVLIGRPYAYGLAVAGEAGVRDVIRNLVADFDLTLGLAGCASVAEIGPELLAQGVIVAFDTRAVALPGSDQPNTRRHAPPPPWVGSRPAALDGNSTRRMLRKPSRRRTNSVPRHTHGLLFIVSVRCKRHA